MTFLFIATIGPVQPFIASARRTRDLYLGSTLLSELSKAAARKIAEQGDGRVYFVSFPNHRFSEVSIITSQN
jgi:CRISPR-associated protein Cmr2